MNLDFLAVRFTSDASHMIRRGLHGVWMGAMVLAFSTVAWAIPPQLLEPVHRDSLAAIMIDPGTPRQNSEPAYQTLLKLLRKGKEIGLAGKWSQSTQLLMDSLSIWPLVKEFPRVYVLHDLQFGPDELGQIRIKSAAMSIALWTRGKNTSIQQFIQRLLNLYTDESNSTLEKFEVGSGNFHRLVDRRLSRWAVWEWGVVGDWFVFSCGPGGTERVRSALNDPQLRLASVDWFVAGCRRIEAEKANLVAYLNARELQKRTQDASDDRLARMITAMGWEDCERLLWSLNWSARGVSLTSLHDVGGNDRLTHRADPETLSSQYLSAIPAAATWYIPLEYDGATMLRGLGSLGLSVFKPDEQQKILSDWQEMVESQKIDVDTDLLNQLGNHVIVHNHPRHPLGLPMMCTLMIEIKGDSNRVRTTVDRMLNYWSKLLDSRRKNSEVDSIAAPSIRRWDDGIWYVQMGIYGPAVFVTDGWIIFSYSPVAIREILQPAAPEATVTKP